ncbi:unnamed protein product [Urochloa humidicola]
MRRSDCKRQEFEPFLAPATEEDKESSSFRAICNVLSRKKVVAFVFSSITGQWQKVTEIGFGSIRPELFMRHYARSCFYWTHPYRYRLLVLDMVRMKFSLLSLPPDPPGRHWRCGMTHAIVEFEGRLGYLALDNGMLELYLRDDGVDDADEWRHGKTIPMPDYHCLSFVLGANEGYLGALLLRGSSSQQMPKPEYFTLHLKTLLLERLCPMFLIFNHCHLYASFPPPFSLPSI